VLAGRNCQDAFCCQHDERGLAAVVCDGCSSGRHSEVGAKLGARLVVEMLRRQLPALDTCTPDDLLETVRRNTLRRFGTLVRAMGSEHVATVNTYFLFTVVGTLIGSRRAIVFMLGDGIALLNGHRLDAPTRTNQPPYLCYGLIESALESMRPGHLRFRVLADVPSSQIETLALGSDGAHALRNKGCEPAASGALSEFWNDDRFFTNPQNLTRRLAQLNRDVKTIDWDARRVERKPGLFLDDAALVIVRRQQPRQEG
jgi:hypothetical protein